MIWEGRQSPSKIQHVGKDQQAQGCLASAKKSLLLRPWLRACRRTEGCTTYAKGQLGDPDEE